MKKTILIFALSRSPWIGGIYYRKNITHMLLTNKSISDKYQIVVLTNQKYQNVFETFISDIIVESCSDKTDVISAMFQALKCCIKYKVKYVFPLKPFKFLKLFGITPVSWIADFQHCHYPEFFEENELKERNYNFTKIAKAKNPLVLSSYDALKDFRTYFSEDRENVYVVHFSSYIEDELKRIGKQEEKKALDKFGLSGQNYAITCNQFWQHKNHKVILDAIKILEEKYPHDTLKFVFTGEPKDRRNPKYIEEIEELLRDEKIKEKVSVLGFIDRMEQLCLMKHAQFIIQPSLFEGWGTVVEDGKILGKPMILSNILVHVEQKNDDCILFESKNSDSLVEAILLMEKQVIENKEIKKNDMTEQYAKKLEKIFV